MELQKELQKNRAFRCSRTATRRSRTRNKKARIKDAAPLRDHMGAGLCCLFKAGFALTKLPSTSHCKLITDGARKTCISTSGTQKQVSVAVTQSHRSGGSETSETQEVQSQDARLGVCCGPQMATPGLTAVFLPCPYSTKDNRALWVSFLRIESHSWGLHEGSALVT